ncbi:hypothetical protein PLICRDRAFT_178709 [Plicaturopsis crispa FD-325 SS-3]|nr:hypothetical protein PLICRDRAFT_178709 [Plicaturopsis crispa FD-325 SS-3]
MAAAASVYLPAPTPRNHKSMTSSIDASETDSDSAELDLEPESEPEPEWVSILAPLRRLKDDGFDINVFASGDEDGVMVRLLETEEHTILDLENSYVAHVP